MMGALAVQTLSSGVLRLRDLAWALRDLSLRLPTGKMQVMGDPPGACR